MYQYEDSPEIQSSEQRSVVFGTMACLITFFIIIIWFNERTRCWFDVTVPLLMSVVIMYRGGLWPGWPRLLRLMMVTLLSGVMFMTALLYLFSALTVILFVFGKMMEEIN
jgi:hypothetical protein